MEQQYLSNFGEVLLFLVGGTVFILVTLLLARIIRPNRPNPHKVTTYESGEDPVSSAWTQFNIRFYVIALIFLLFEIEVVFLFPWSTIFANKTWIQESQGAWGWFALIEMVLFIFILALGLLYAWVNDHLDWVKPKQTLSTFQSPVPKSLYDKINQQYTDSTVLTTQREGYDKS
jgi:NADH-quinone oxidoreductase subunit A